MKKFKITNSKSLSILVVALSVGLAGFTFMFKLYEFVAVSTTGIVPGIVSATVLPYFFISGGFLFLAGWAWAGGHYKDIEGPKQEMLRQEEIYNEMERRDKLFYE